MKSEKLSLKGIKNVLSRAELKKIMAGSGGGCTGCSPDNNGPFCCSCYSGQYPSAPYHLSCIGDCSTYCRINYPSLPFAALVPCSNCGFA
jgi:hypothetical protein